MNRLIAVFLLSLALPASAETFTLPNGKLYEAEHPSWTEKLWILPSGRIWRELVPVRNLAYVAEGLIPIAKANTLTLREELEMWHDLVASHFGINSRETKEVNQCESQWNDYPNIAISVLGDKGKAYGITQFHEKTFNLWRKEAKMPELKYKEWKDQLTLQGWAFSKGEKYKDDWVCYVLIFIKKTRPISTNWR